MLDKFVLLYSTGPKIFCAGSNFLGQFKCICINASSKTFVPGQKPNLLNGNHLLVWDKMFGTCTKCTYINFWSGPKDLDQLKIFWDL